jgi:hypothetical protein
METTESNTLRVNRVQDFRSKTIRINIPVQAVLTRQIDTQETDLPLAIDTVHTIDVGCMLVVYGPEFTLIHQTYIAAGTLVYFSSTPYNVFMAYFGNDTIYDSVDIVGETLWIGPGTNGGCFIREVKAQNYTFEPVDE